MTEQPSQEAYLIFGIIWVSVPIICFLLLVIMLMRARKKRGKLADEILDVNKRKNGKH